MASRRGYAVSVPLLFVVLPVDSRACPLRGSGSTRFAPQAPKRTFESRSLTRSERRSRRSGKREERPSPGGHPWSDGRTRGATGCSWRVWAIKRCPRPASPGSGCQTDPGPLLDTLRVAPGGLRERLTFRRWRVGQPLDGGLARQPALRIRR
jgi:hypothetical protein